MIKEYDGINWYGYIIDGKKQYYKNPEYGYLHVYKYQLETGLELMDNQVVHHIDGDKRNNDISNLVHMFRWCHRRMHGKNRTVYKMSAETRNKISKANTGRKVSAETRNKMRGRKVSAETRNKISKSHTGKKKRSKKILCVETGTIYNSMVDAAKDMNTQQSNISRVCRGERKSAAGYHFKFL